MWEYLFEQKMCYFKVLFHRFYARFNNVFFRFLIDFILFCRFLINEKKKPKMAKNARNVGKLSENRSKLQRKKKKIK